MCRQQTCEIALKSREKAAERCFQRLPFEKRHGQERLAVRFVDLIDRADVGVVMVEPTCKTPQL
jgi:hypothetical protein